MTDLKPCPFCGEIAELITKHVCTDMQFDDDCDYAYVQCKVCNARGTVFRVIDARYRSSCKIELDEIKHNAIEAWNIRI